MKAITPLVLLLASALLAPAADPPRPATVSAKHTLTLAGARSIAAAAEEFARQHGATPSIAVVDEAGVLLCFLRLDGNFPAAAMVSLGKARTAATFRKPTRELEETVNSGRVSMTALPDFTPLQGGIPILHEGQLVGAIGVSGARSAAQDEEVARAGAAAFADPDRTLSSK